jgi:tRNA(Ser,Leu) C12 N-acetylase TAN1
MKKTRSQIPRQVRADLREEIERFKLDAEREPRGFSRSMGIEARRELWDFTPARTALREEIAELSTIFRRRDTLPEDLDLRIARAAIALYLLDKADELLNLALETKRKGSLSLFSNAAAGIRSVLGPDYFSKGAKRIIKDYLEGEVALTACAESLGAGLPTLEQAVKDYKAKVASEIDAAR